MKKNLTGECGTLFQNLAATLRKHGVPGQESDKLVRRLLKSVDEVIDGGEGSIKSLEVFAEKDVFARGFDIAEEWRMFAMLSGIKTQIISPVSAAIMSQMRTVEDTVGSIFGRLLSDMTPQELALVRRQASIERGEIAKGQIQIAENFKMWFGRKDGSSPWDLASNNKLEESQMNSAAAMQALMRLNDGKDGFITKGLQFFGNISQLSGNMLQRGDQASKLIAGRARHISSAYGKFIKQGFSDTEAIRMAREQADVMLEMRGNARQQLQTALVHKRGATPDQMPKDLEEILERANVRSEEDITDALDSIVDGITAGEKATFTHRIEKKNWIDKIGQHISNSQQDIPALKLVMPFVKTPTNIASETWERTFGTGLGLAEATIRKLRATMGGADSIGEPLSNLAKRLESPDPRVRARAIGEMTVGVTSMSAIVHLAGQNDPDTGMPKITGTAPSDARLAAAWKEAGWQPRSIMVGGNYISYDRLDPLAGAVFGFAADLTASMNWASDDGAAHQEGAGLFLGIAGALGSNITSKTWMKGLREAAELAADPSERNVYRFVKNIVGSAAPGVLRDTQNLLSEEQQIKDISTLGEAFMAKIPGLSSKVDARRNFIGEKLQYTDVPGQQKWNTIMPFNITRIKDDVLSRELSRLPQGFSMPSTKMYGADLKDAAFDRPNGQSAYDRMLEISSKVKIGGRTLRQEMRRIVKSAEYQRLDIMDIEGEMNPRTALLSKTINKYRKKARTELLKENKTLRNDVRNRQRARQTRRAGLGFDFYTR